MQTQVQTARGRCDIIVETVDYIYVMELKLDGSADEALAQTKEKGYMELYLTRGQHKLAIGINFSSDSKQIEEFKTEVY